MSKLKDVRGEVYGRYTIIENLPSVKYGSHSYKRVKAKCECGNEREVTYRDLTKGKSKSCGCYAESLKNKVEKGDVYTNWTIIKEAEHYISKKGEKSRKFLCECVCGKQKEVHLNSLLRGDSKSCGCQGKIRQEKIKKEKTIPQDTKKEQWKECLSFKGYYISTLGNLFNYKRQKYSNKKLNYSITHNGKKIGFSTIKEMYRTFIKDFKEEDYYVVVKGELNINNLELIHRETRRKLSNVYGAMKSRCSNKNSPDYLRYGGRGIIIEESFNTFDKFYYWSLKSGFEFGLEIDRIDNNGNYSEDNCRWTTKTQNSRNTRRLVFNEDLVRKVKYGEWKNLDKCEIANILNCNVSSVDDVIKGRTWRDI